jgi:hypothetical protein
VTVSLDQPFLVVATGEFDHRLAKILDVGVELGPQALLLEGADEALGAAVAGRLAGEGGTVFDPKPGERSRNFV